MASEVGIGANKRDSSDKSDQLPLKINENCELTAQEEQHHKSSMQRADSLSPLFGNNNFEQQQQFNAEQENKTNLLSGSGVENVDLIGGSAKFGSVMPLVEESERSIGGANEGDCPLARADTNEHLLAGFVLLRLVQLLNFDVYYIGLSRADYERTVETNENETRVDLDGRLGRLSKGGGVARNTNDLSESKQQLVSAQHDDDDDDDDQEQERREDFSLNASAWHSLDNGQHLLSDKKNSNNINNEIMHDDFVGSSFVKSNKLQAGANFLKVRKTNSKQKDEQQAARELTSGNNRQSRRAREDGALHERTLLDELAQLNPLRKYAKKCAWLATLCQMLKILLSLVAIMISVDKTISTIVLCLISRPDIRARPGNIGLAYETSDVTMSWFVLILINLSSMYILFSTVFNGHLLWNLLSQRLFLVNRRFQYKTMLSMLVFIYLEYIVNISFINNLFGWSFEGENSSNKNNNNNNNKSKFTSELQQNNSLYSKSTRQEILRTSSASGSLLTTSNNIHTSYGVLSNLEIFVTEKDETNWLVDILLTCFQFARGIIRIGPYITITYVTICLNEHIKTIRNQSLLTDSLKKKQKLSMVVKRSRGQRKLSAAGRANSSLGALQSSQASQSNGSGNGGGGGGGVISTALRAHKAKVCARKKRVIFVTDASGQSCPSESPLNANASPVNVLQTATYNLNVRQATTTGDNESAMRQLQLAARKTPSPISLAPSSPERSMSSLVTSDYESSIQSFVTSETNHIQSMSSDTRKLRSSQVYNCELKFDCENNDEKTQEKLALVSRVRYLNCIRNFDELETYITNLYIFTGRLNRLMSRQGLAMFFIVHNLVITGTLIVPEAIRGGPPMVGVIRVLVVFIGIVPFIAGQALNGQLDQLSKQIDRIIIQQKFVGRKRDNLVRIRELLHDIRVNCGGMLNFNVETGIKYLVVAFASAFFIEQEGEFYLSLCFFYTKF